MSSVTDIIMIMLVLAGLYIIIKSGKLQELFKGGLPQLPSLPGLPSPSGGGAAPPAAVPGGSHTNVTGGELEQHGDCRREWDIVAPHLNAEAGGYFLIEPGAPNDTISIKMRGCKHGGSTGEGNMCDNIHYLSFTGGGKGAFGKQCPHLNYCWFGSPKYNPGDIRGKWIGMKAIQWNEGAGVHMQTWLDVPKGSGWKLFADFIDTGNTGCSGEAKPPFTKSPWKGACPARANFRIDKACNAKSQGLYLKEIAGPRGGGGAVPSSTPAAPTKRIIKGSNYARSSSYNSILSRL